MPSCFRLPEIMYSGDALCCGGGSVGSYINEESKKEPNDATLAAIVESKVTPRRRGKKRSTNVTEALSEKGNACDGDASVVPLESSSLSGGTSTSTKQNKSKRFWHSSSKSTSDAAEEEKETQKILKERFPTITPMERKRFSKGRAMDRICTKLEGYVEWREKNQLDSKSFKNHPEFKSDHEVWQFAANHTSKHYDEGEVKMSPNFPRIARFGGEEDLRASDGKRIVQVLPALIDKDLAPLDFYALTFAVYVELKFGRDTDEQIHVLVDARTGEGWPNVPAMNLIPFVKSLVRYLEDNMPERMFRCVLYPLKNAAKPIWGIFKSFLNPKVVKKIVIYWGPATPESPVPKEMTNETYSADFVKAIESQRTAEIQAACGIY